MNKVKNKCLNFLKGISCIGVIIMHCGFPTVIGDLICYLFKFAVPIFFMISGYFAYYEQEEKIGNRLPEKIKHIFKILLIAEIAYGIYALLKKLIWNDVIDIQLNVSKIVSKILVGTFFNGTLWFLYALFWSYVCLYIIHKTNTYQKAYKIAPCILILHVVVRTYVKRFDWYNLNYFRNFLMYGLPFVVIGNYIHRNKEILCAKITNRKCLIGIACGTGLTVIEYLVSRQALDIYIGTIILSCAMFLYAIKNPENSLNSILCNIGDKLSMYIYILHMLAIEIAEKVGENFNTTVYDWVKPINAIILSILLA